MENLTLQKSIEISNELEKDLKINPGKYKILSGFRPTGNLHLGHYFGALANRAELQKLNIEMFFLIADYQVLTDHDNCDKISQSTKELLIDYYSAGIDLDNEKTFIYPHSYVPEANQLLVPFLTLVSMSELERNPTVKEEIQSAGISVVNAGMFCYPVHQVADILSVRANVIPVGADQLPHIEMSRVIAKRFNNKFCKEKPLFEEPKALLTKVLRLQGLDGDKMSKSRGNSIMLKSTREEIINVVKKAKTDSERFITFDPENRPDVARLLTLISLTSGRNEVDVANEIGNGGAKMLKDMLVESVDKFLTPIRKRRKELENNPEKIKEILFRGVDKAREEATKTLVEVRKVMNMCI